MPISLVDRDVPVDALVLPFQSVPGNGPGAIDVRVLAPEEAGAAAERLRSIAEQISWKAPRGDGFPRGHLVVSGAEVSRQNRSALIDALGSRLAVCSDPDPAALASAWESFLDAYRATARELACRAAARRQAALEQAAAARAAYEADMREWIAERGSVRLQIAHSKGERVHRLYREERRDQELPGLLIDADGSIPVLPLRETPAHAAAARDAVEGWIGDTLSWRDAAPPDVDLVYVQARHAFGRDDISEPGLPAVRVRGWLGRHTLFGYCPSPNEPRPPYAIDHDYPDGVQVQTSSPLRPTAYASAYGVRHPAVQAALAHAAIVVIDMFPDSEPEAELEALLADDAHELVDDQLIADLGETLFLVGWKLGQPHKLAISSLAEAIAAKLLLEEADAKLDFMHEEGALTDEALRAAQGELATLEEDLLDEDLLEYFEMPGAYRLEDVVGGVVEPRRLMLWTPFHAAAGDPPPRITGDDEPRWEDLETAGMTAREAVRASAQQREKKRAEQRETIATRLRTLRWRTDTDRRGVTVLLAEEADGGCLIATPPVAVAGARGVERGWSVERWPSVEAFRADGADEVEELEISSWEDWFRALPAQAHPLAVDAAMDTVAQTMSWHEAMSAHALPAGPPRAIEQAAEALAGVVALRDALEQARAAGVIRDRRLTRFGLRHEHFGDRDAARYEAIVRFKRPDDTTPDQALASFHECIYDFSSLPVALTMDVDPEDPSNVRVACAMAVHTIDEAWSLSHDVISQLHWRTAFEPVDLEQGEDADNEDGIGYEIDEINRDRS